MQYYGVKLLPGAMVSDHCAAFRNAFYKYFPEGVFGQCYPHIKRKYGEGEYTSKKWVHFDEAGEDIKGIHLAGTPEMKTLITGRGRCLLGQLGHADERLLGFELCGPLGLLEYL